MQTFLPYPDFKRSAQCLDYRRLGKQRVECWQIYCCLTGEGSLRWRNHPDVKMWEGYEGALLVYGIAICEEWIGRGYKDSLLPKFELCLSFCKKRDIPFWLGDEKFHSAHRSNLLRKDSVYYGKFGWKESSDLPYFWPV